MTEPLRSSVIDPHHCRLPVPAHPLYPARSTWDHLDCSEEVRLWWWPGTHAGISVSLVSTVRLPYYYYFFKTTGRVRDSLVSSCFSRQLQDQNSSWLHHRAQPQCLSLPSEYFWQTRQSECFTLQIIFKSSWAASERAVLTCSRIEIVHSLQRSWKTCSKCFPTCPGVQMSTTPFVLMIRDGSPTKDISHSGRES